jgi:putative transposase
VSAFIDMHRDRFGVEPICWALDVSASAYYQRARGGRCARDVEDERLLARIREVQVANYEAYGYRRTWKALRRSGETAPRCRVQRLMRAHGIQGAKRRGKPWRTTKPDPNARRPRDLVQRDFTAGAPNRLWTGDFTYLRCWEGVVYFSFVIDVFSRMVVGWQLASHMRTDLVLDALRMALGLREPGADFELVHHTDAGSQGGFNRSSQRHDERSCDGSTATEVGSSRSSSDALAGSSVGGASRGAPAVLGRDRSWCVQRGRGRRGWSVSSGWCPVVSRGWRDAHCHPGPAVGALLVTC